MATVAEKMTAIADPMRTLSGRTDKLNLDEMATIVTDANDEVSSQADLISQISTVLDGKAGGGGITPTGTKQITTNGTHDVTTYANAEVNVPVGVFPTGTKQITENGEYDVTSYAKTKVNVPTKEPVTEELSVTVNGTYTPDAGVDGYSKVTVNVPTGGNEPVLQEKTVSSSATRQEVIPDNGYDGLSKVTVDAMPTATQATPSIEISSAGLITAKATQSAGYVAAGTKQATKQLTTQAAKTVTPGKSDQTAVASGRYTTGAIIVKGDSALEPGNIKSGVSIFGVPGSYTGSSGGGGGSGGTVETCQVTFDPVSELADKYHSSVYFTVAATVVNGEGGVEELFTDIAGEPQTFSCVKNSVVFVYWSTYSSAPKPSAFLDANGEWDFLGVFPVGDGEGEGWLFVVRGDTTIFVTE